MNTTENISTQDYDTSINVIGGLSNVDSINYAIEAHFSETDTVHNIVINNNEFQLRTDRSRTRVERAIRRVFLRFQDQSHLEFIQNIFQSKMPLPERELVLFWQFAFNNILFRDISTNVFVRIYFSGRAGLSKDDIIAYLKEFLSQNKSLNLDWSQSTINTLSTKYLNFMTKLNLLEGARKKSFQHLILSSELLIIFLYLIKLYPSKTNDILRNELIPLSFLNAESLRERLKKLSKKGHFEMEYSGTELKIEPTHNYNEICDVLYQ